MGVWTSTPVLVGLVAATTVCGAALVFGGALERKAAVWIWIAWVFTPLLQALTGEYDPALLLTLVDATMLLILASFALEGRRGWLVAAVAAQGALLAIDLLRLVELIGSYLYLTAMAAAAYVLLLALAVGVWARWRERRASRIGIPS